MIDFNKDNPVFLMDFGINAFLENGQSFKVIFKNEYKEGASFGDVPYNSRQISCLCESKKINELDLKIKDLISINEIEYFIQNIEENLQFSRLILKVGKGKR